jgi:hypothetical protein
MKEEEEIPKLDNINRLVVCNNKVDQCTNEGRVSEDRMACRQCVLKKGGVKGGLLQQASGFLVDLPLWQHHWPAVLLADLDVLLLVVLLEVDTKTVMVVKEWLMLRERNLGSVER